MAYRRRQGPEHGRPVFIALLQLLAIIYAATNDQETSFAEPIPNVTVAVGRDASLPCVVNNLGQYKVAWIHIDRQMILTIHRHVIAKINRFSVSHDNQKTWRLHVNHVQQEDRGYYMCQVNTNPMINQVGYLQVVVPPNILDEASTPSAVAVRENQNISLTCKAEGFPAPKIKWKREDQQQISVDRRKKLREWEGESLNLTRIARTDMGVYLCIATNGIPPTVSKRITVDVEFAPMIWVPNQLVGAPASTNVTVDCHTEAFPRAISYWVYDNQMIPNTAKHSPVITESSYRSHMQLTVRHLTSKDFGNYRCISKNSLGETEGSIRLYEIPMPSSAPKATEVRSGSPKEDRPAPSSPRTFTKSAPPEGNTIAPLVPKRPPSVSPPRSKSQAAPGAPAAPTGPTSGAGLAWLGAVVAFVPVLATLLH